MNITLTKMGKPVWDMDEVKSRVALSLRDSFPKMFNDRWLEAREVFYQAYADIHLQVLKPLPGAASMLKQLAEWGIKLGVVSNKNGDFLRKEAEHLGWSPLFERLVGANDAAADKPSAAPVQLILASLGQPPVQKVWFVGDGAVDMECAANSGCHGVLLREDPWRKDEFSSHPPCQHFFTCPEFAQAVGKLVTSRPNS